MNTTSNQIRLNGELADVTAETLSDILAYLGIQPDQRGVAVAVNGAVVPCRAWPATGVSAGDDIEVISAVQGG